MQRSSREIPVVRVITRHRPECSRRTRGQRYHSCSCLKSLAWAQHGRTFVEPASTDQLAVAEQKARDKQRELENSTPDKVPTTTTVASAITLFLATKRDEGIGLKHLAKLEQIFKDEFLPFCNQRNLATLKEVKLTDLEAWRLRWEGATTTKAKKQGRVIGFFDWCLRRDFVLKNPALGLGKIKIAKEDKKPTLALTDEQFAQVLASIPKVNGSTTELDRTKLRCLVLLQRYSGLALRDAVSLERSKLERQADGWYHLNIRRSKTGVDVFVPLTKEVAEELLACPNSDKRLFFATAAEIADETSTDTTCKKWGALMGQKLDRVADLKDEDGLDFHFHSHMLRDTFAVACFNADMSTEDVAALLGHTNIQITQQHYSPWIKSRSERLGNRFKAAFQK
jgi:integrase/recombinase XerD